MNLFEKLRYTTLSAQNGQDLPDYLAEQIYAILENQAKFICFEAEIANLTEQVLLYDTYGQTGYLGMGVNSVILEETLKILTAKQAATEKDTFPILHPLFYRSTFTHRRMST